MKVICAWCKRVLGERKPLRDRGITHGICPKCLAGVLKREGL